MYRLAITPVPEAYVVSRALGCLVRTLEGHHSSAGCVYSSLNTEVFGTYVHGHHSSARGVYCVQSTAVLSVRCCR